MSVPLVFYTVDLVLSQTIIKEVLLSIFSSTKVHLTLRVSEVKIPSSLKM